ncbi:MAG: HDOD domain-containing protein [Kofleriaceae bacterium]
MALPAPAREPNLAAQLVEQLRTTEIRVPPYPAVAGQLDRLSRDPRTSVAEVAAIVATDAALAATVLRHANSAARSSNAPATLEAAIWKLGVDELTRVVLASSVGAAASAPGPLALLRRDQWRRSLLSAMFCKELAGRRGVAPDQAFLAGLLHDFGAVVVVACLESLGAAHLPVLPEATWRRLVDDLHIEFGMVVVARWKLPEPIAEVIASHHTPHTCMRVHRPLVQLVAIVDQIVEILDRPEGGIAALAEVPGLEHDERFRIGALMPKVAEQMARFETPAVREVGSLITPTPSLLDGGWPVDFVIESRSQAEYRACALAPSMIAFRSAAMLQPAWLAEVTLRCEPDTIAMLVNVKSCEPQAGEFLVTAQPFGLAGEDKAAWLRLIARTRTATPNPR